SCLAAEAGASAEIPVPGRSLSSVVCPQFADDVVQMDLHGVLREFEVRRDRLVLQTARDELQNLEFPLGQFRPILARGHQRGPGRVRSRMWIDQVSRVVFAATQQQAQY